MIASIRSGEMFSLKREEEAEHIEGVEVLKYLGRMLYRSYDNWPSVLSNIWKARQVWGRFKKFLQREGS